MRPTVTAGLANDVLLVNQYAAPMYAPTAAADSAARPVRARAKIRCDQPGGGDDLADEMAGGDAVLGGDLEHLAVEHDVGQDRAEDAAGDLGDGVGGDVAGTDPVPGATSQAANPLPRQQG